MCLSLSISLSLGFSPSINHRVWIRISRRRRRINSNNHIFRIHSCNNLIMSLIDIRIAILSIRSRTLLSHTQRPSLCATPP